MEDPILPREEVIKEKLFKAGRFGEYTVSVE